MSLINQTCWVVGGVGVIGRGITQGLLKAGATVIVNSRSTDRLNKLEEDLKHHGRLVTIHGSLLPGYAAGTIHDALGSTPLNHVVAHGAVRYWGAKSGAGYDETHSVNRGSLLTTHMDDFGIAASHLASLHFSAAQELIPRIQFSNGRSSYTFVTGDGGGHPRGKRSPFQEINAHHVWGLSAALRGESLKKVNCREVRVKLDVNRPLEERMVKPRDVPLSEDIGMLCAGLVGHTVGVDDSGKLIEVSDHEILESLLTRYGIELEVPLTLDTNKEAYST
eukprot:scaffold2192_cov268-Chaetoceros_neogracile.AAC.104